MHRCMAGRITFPHLPESVLCRLSSIPCPFPFSDKWGVIMGMYIEHVLHYLLTGTGAGQNTWDTIDTLWIFWVWLGWNWKMLYVSYWQVFTSLKSYCITASPSPTFHCIFAAIFFPPPFLHLDTASASVSHDGSSPSLYHLSIASSKHLSNLECWASIPSRSRSGFSHQPSSPQLALENPTSTNTSRTTCTPNSVYNDVE